MSSTRNLVLVLGDQLDRRLSALDDYDAERDVIWMAENSTEATHVWSHKRRLVLFFAAMRHYRDELRQRGYEVWYHALEIDARRDSGSDFGAILSTAINELTPQRLVMTECGDYRVHRMLINCAKSHSLTLQVRPDRHFYWGTDEFDEWARARNSLLLEPFYRRTRQAQSILMDGDDPTGGQWNYDRANREAFGKQGPSKLPHVQRFRPDEITAEVIEMVSKRFRKHPGSIENFDLPVTHDEARAALRDFIDNRLPLFGDYQDALWTNIQFAYHSRLSAALNLHLLDPRDCVGAAVEAHENGHAPLNSVEGYVRQVLGWREFVRGVYRQEMPGYAKRNALRAHLPVPRAFWDGETDMSCVADAMRNVLKNGYAHHIQRLMVLGLFALVAGVQPQRFNEWHMAMYLDAIDWASLPNTLGMSQFADGGLVGSKPYCASGNYINKMSNYCKTCRFEYRQAVGEKACPITTLYWDFLDRNVDAFRDNPRMGFQVKNLEKKRRDNHFMAGLRAQARDLKQRIEKQDYI